MSDWTTIRVLKSTRDFLLGLGFKGESFDDVIVRLLKDNGVSGIEDIKTKNERQIKGS